MNEKISIVIPAYNSEKTLEQCLDSLINQDFNDFEIIVVDNNSTDKTKKIIFDFIKKDKRVRYVFEKERRRGAARNTGEKMAKGEIILMTDSDCILPKDWIKKMADPIIKKESEAVQGSETNIVKNYWAKQVQIRQDERTARRKVGIIGALDTKNFAILKTTLEKVGFSSRKYSCGNDLALEIELNKQNIPLKFIDVRVGHYHPDRFWSVFKKQFDKAYWSKMIADDNKDYLKDKNFLSGTCQTTYSFFIFFLGLPITIFSKGLSYFCFEFLYGISWRLGLISGVLSSIFKKRA